jgi:Flp pilus assembly pilin Flp
VRQAERNPEGGQALAEYAIIVAAIAVGCLFALLILRSGIDAVFGSAANPTGPTPVQAPRTTTPAPTYPTTIEECEDGGWTDFQQFESEAECSEYVEGLTP